MPVDPLLVMSAAGQLLQIGLITMEKFQEIAAAGEDATPEMLKAKLDEVADNIQNRIDNNG